MESETKLVSGAGKGKPEVRVWVSALKEGKSDIQPQVCLITWELKPYLSPGSSRRRAKSRFLSPLSELLPLRGTKPLCLWAPAAASLLPQAPTLKISPGSEEESLKAATPSHRQQGHLAGSLVTCGWRTAENNLFGYL